MKHALQLLPAALLALSLQAQAAVTITIQEVGNDVVVTGSGSIDSLNGFASLQPEPLTLDTLEPTRGFVLAGTADPSSSMTTYGYMRTGPDSFGGGSHVSKPTENTGDLFAFDPNSAPSFGLLYLPSDYVPGATLNFSTRWSEQSLENLDIELGSYEWILTSPWAPGSAAETITLNVIPAAELPPETAPPPATATPVPGLGAFGLIGLAAAIGTAGAAMARRRKQR